MVFLPYVAAGVVAVGELAVLGKLGAYILGEANIPDSRHPIQVGFYWLLAVLLNLANSASLVYCSFKGFQNYGVSLAEEDLFNFTFDLLIVFTLVCMLVAGVLCLNRWVRTSFFDGEWNYLFMSELREFLFADPQDSNWFAVGFHTVVLIIANGIALVFTSGFLLKL